MREAHIQRITSETSIDLLLQIDGVGEADIEMEQGFFKHMLDLLCKHGLLNMTLRSKGDTHIDCHHLIEDVGIVLGKAFHKALGERKGITRYSTVFTPMDEAMTMISLDISGRPYLHFNCSFHRTNVGAFETELVEEFFRAFVNHGAVTLHINLIYGKNTHHIIESMFKGLGHAIHQACRVHRDYMDNIRSTKGILRE